jgi:hypothetical protein
VKRFESSSAICFVRWSNARNWNAPPTKMTDGPLPDWSKAIVVPSLEMILPTEPLLLHYQQNRHDVLMYLSVQQNQWSVLI